MADEGTAAYKAAREAKALKRKGRREVFDAEYDKARHVATAAGYQLVRHSANHYSARYHDADGAMVWMLNIWPGPKRVAWDKSRTAWRPRLRLGDDWTLATLAVALADAMGRKDGAP